MPWFDSLPLDWTNPHTRRAEELLLTVYKRSDEVLDLAENAGVDISSVNQSLPPKLMLRQVMNKARSSANFERLLAEVLANDERKAIWPELATLLSGHEDAIRAARFNGSPTLASMSLGTTGLDVRSRGGDAARPLSGNLERVINAAAGFADVAVFGRRLATAEVRVARFEIGGQPKGTGFLVGERLLLTNWHVVAPLKEASKAADLGRACFDCKVAADGSLATERRTVAIAEEWLAASSEHANIPEELGSEGPQPGTFDFALVRLAEPVGAQGIAAGEAAEHRGWYKLDGSVYSFDEREPLHIVGHPRARPMQLSYASPANGKLTSYNSRIRYTTNTEGGSSGSPVFNKDWRIVALHHAAGPTDRGGPLDMQVADFNQGVPIYLIVGELKRQLAGKPELDELGLAQS